MSKKLTNTIRANASNKEDHNIVVNATIPGSCCCCCCDDPETDILFELYALLATLPKRGPRIISKYIDCRIDVVNVFDPFWIEVVVNVEPQEFHKDILVGELMQRLLRAWPAYIPIKVRIEPIFFYGPLFLGQVKLRGYLDDPVLRGSFIASPTEYCGPLFLGQIKLRGYLDESILQGRFTASPSEFFGPLFLGQIKLRGNFYEGILAGKFSATPDQFYGPLFLGQIKLRGYFDRGILRGSFSYGGGTGPSIHYFATHAGSIQYAFSSVGGGDGPDIHEGLASVVCFPYGHLANSTEHEKFDRRVGHSWVLSSGGVSDNITASEYNWWNEGNIGMFMLSTAYSRPMITQGHTYRSGNDDAYISTEAIISFDMRDSTIFHPSSTTGTYYLPLILPVSLYDHSINEDDSNNSTLVTWENFFEGLPGDWANNDASVNGYWKRLRDVEDMGDAKNSIPFNSGRTYTEHAEFPSGSVTLTYCKIPVAIYTVRRYLDQTSSYRINVFYSTWDRFPTKITVAETDRYITSDGTKQTIDRNYVVVDQATGLNGNGLNQWEAMAKFSAGNLLGRGHSWLDIKNAIIALINKLNP